MTSVGNVDFKKIENRQFITFETDKAKEIIEALTNQNIQYSGRFNDEKIFINFSKDDFSAINDIVKSVISPVRESIQETVQEQANVQLEDVQIIIDVDTIEELKKQIEELNARLDKQEHKEQPIADEKHQDTKWQDNEFVVEEKAVSEPVTPKNTLLPFLSSKVIQHENKIASLEEKIAIREDKIQNNQSKIDRLSERADKLEATNSMWKELLERTPFPASAIVQAMIKQNESKITQIRENKIPAHEQKIDFHKNKITGLSKQVDIATSKIKRCRALSGIVKSFTMLNVQKCRENFSKNLDNLHESSKELLGVKIERFDTQIEKLSQRFERTESSVEKLNIQRKIDNISVKRDTCMEKINSLNNLDEKYTSKNDKTIDTLIDNADKKLDEVAKSEKDISVAEIGDSVAVKSAEIVSPKIEKIKEEINMATPIEPVTTYRDELIEKMVAEKHNNIDNSFEYVSADQYKNQLNSMSNEELASEFVNLHYGKDYTDGLITNEELGDLSVDCFDRLEAGDTTDELMVKLSGVIEVDIEQLRNMPQFQQELLADSFASRSQWQNIDDLALNMKNDFNEYVVSGAEIANTNEEVSIENSDLNNSISDRSLDNRAEEFAVSEHDETQLNPIEDLLPKISDVTGLSVNQLKAMPQDVQEILADTYVNNADSPRLESAIASVLEMDKMPSSKTLEKENPLKNAEMSVEQNYNSIDGIINNEPPRQDEQPNKDKKETEKERPVQEKSSVLLKLAKNKEEVRKQPPNRDSKQKDDREI